MPENPVTTPITDQEIAFAHLVLSGTMNDKQAAEAAGLNPTSAAYTKSKPRVRAYMEEHRAAVKEKLVEQEAEAFRSLTLRREQILARLWELANVSFAETRGSISGQVKAMSMIIAIEGLIPNRRLSTALPRAAAMPPGLEVYLSELMSRRQTESEDAAASVTATEAQASTPPPPAPAVDTASAQINRSQAIPQKPAADIPTDSNDTNWFTAMVGRAYDVPINSSGPFKLAIPKGAFAGGRGNR